MTDEWLLLGVAAFLAGMIDAIAGGGGMLQIPALFTLLPGAAPASLLGTSKLASCAGTIAAAIRYMRHQRPDWCLVAPAMLCALVTAVIGALVVAWLPADIIRKALPPALLALLLFTLLKKEVGIRRSTISRPRQRVVAVGGSGLAGFYDGVLGAGTGAFLKILWVRGVGLDFLSAAAPAKLVNIGSNIGAIVLFTIHGLMLWPLAIWMMCCNVAGAQTGTWLAIRKGNQFIRRTLLVVIAALILKTFYDGYLS